MSFTLCMLESTSLDVAVCQCGWHTCRLSLQQNLQAHMFARECQVQTGRLLRPR